MTRSPDQYNGLTQNQSDPRAQKTAAGKQIGDLEKHTSVIEKVDSHQLSESHESAGQALAQKPNSDIGPGNCKSNASEDVLATKNGQLTSSSAGSLSVEVVSDEEKAKKMEDAGHLTETNTETSKEAERIKTEANSKALECCRVKADNGDSGESDAKGEPEPSKAEGTDGHSGVESDGTNSGSKSQNGNNDSKLPGDDDSVGGPYMPRPVKQTKVSKRKKIVFTREQLMEYESKSTAKPKGFPSDLMRDIQLSEPPMSTYKPSPIRSSSSTPLRSAGPSPSKYTPPAASESGTPKSSNVSPEKSFHHSTRHQRHSPHTAAAKHADVTLVRSKNRWQPNLHMTLTQKVRGYLNKLSPEQHEGLFEKLYELVKLNCSSTEDLKGLVNEIFGKAVTEKNYAWLYAKLSLEMAERCPTFRLEKKMDTGKKISRVVEFKTILLTLCHKEFQGVSPQVTKLKKRMETTNDTVIKELMIDKLKERRQGTVRFMGELFKVRLERAKVERILHMCIQNLLRDIRNPDEEDIVCLEVLLETAGKQLDVHKAKNYMNQYFMRISKMQKNPGLPLRLSFKCQDLIDLRKRKWSSRRETTVAKPSQESRNANNNRSVAPSRPEATLEQITIPKRVGNRYSSLNVASPATSSVQLVRKPPQRAPQPAPILKKSPRTVKKDVTFNLKPDSKSLEKIERDVVALVEEYYGCGKEGLKEAALCIQDIKSPAHHWMVVKHAILLSLEKRERERKLTIELLVWLFKFKKVLTTADFQKGLRAISEDLDDIKMDIPYAGKFVDSMCQRFLKYKCIDQATLNLFKSQK